MKPWELEKAKEELAFIDDFEAFLTEAEEAIGEGSLLEEGYFSSIAAENQNLSGLEVSHSVFENCAFSNSVFSKAYFKDCLFKGCDVSNCDFSSSTFRGCCFEQVKGVGTDLSESVFKQVEMKSCLFRYAVFTAGLLQDLRLTDCDLTEAWLDSCKGKNWQFADVNLSKANLYKTPLKGVDLRTCQIEGMILSEEAREINGAVVDWMQAADLARLLGVVIKE